MASPSEMAGALHGVGSDGGCIMGCASWRGIMAGVALGRWDFGPQPGCGGGHHRWPTPCMGAAPWVVVERYASGCVGRHRSGVMVGWGGAPGGGAQGTPEDSPCASCTSPRIVLLSRRLSLKRVSCCFHADSLLPPSCCCCAVWCVRTIAELPWAGLFSLLSHFICLDE